MGKKDEEIKSLVEKKDEEIKNLNEQVKILSERLIELETVNKILTKYHYEIIKKEKRKEK